MPKIFGAVVAMALAIAPQFAQSADFPTRYVRVVVPFAAGGGVDIMARIIGQKLSELWGQQVVIENRPGAAGAVGAQVVASSTPDGYTLMFTADNVMTINPIIRKTSYDPIASFTPVSQVTSGSYILAINPEVKAGNIKEFVALAKQNPGKINYGTPGIGSLHHLGIEFFNHVAGVELVHVPFTGTGPALVATLQGQVQLNFGSMSATLPQVESGHLRAIATTGATRAPQLPDVPTVKESGYPEYEVTGWYGLLAPANAPSDIVEKISTDIRAVLARPDVQARLAEHGSTPVGSSPSELKVLIAHDLEQWSKLIKGAHLKMGMAEK